MNDDKSYYYQFINVTFPIILGTVLYQKGDVRKMFLDLLIKSILFSAIKGCLWLMITMIIKSGC